MFENDASSSRRGFMATVAYGVGIAGLGVAAIGGRTRAEAGTGGKFPLTLTDAEWKKRLTPSQYYILREEGTERAFTSPLNDQHGKGVFACAGCSQKLYASDTKFDSGTGWPSFYEPIKGAVGESRDGSLASREPRSIARIAAATWGMSSTTGRVRRGCATA